MAVQQKEGFWAKKRDVMYAMVVGGPYLLSVLDVRKSILWIQINAQNLNEGRIQTRV